MKFHSGGLEEAFQYFASFTNLEQAPPSPRAFRLDRMFLLLEMFGNPQNDFRSIHVAGSKGKGSTSVFLASVLQAAGLRTGLYTSPHVSSYTERIRLASSPLPERILLQSAEDIAQAVDGMSPEDLPGSLLPTTFELLTLLGFLAFSRAECQWAVIETGIGGRLDATNTVLPEASVITPVELEHTEFLGNRLEDIAREKGGIIKPETPVFIGYQPPPVVSVLTETADERKAVIRLLAEEVVRLDSETTAEGTSYSFALKDGFSVRGRLGMAGDFQGENAALAVTVLHSLFPAMQPETIQHGLERAVIPGRLEVIPGRPHVVLDAAHTPNSVARMLSSFRKMFPEGGVLIFGSVLGKDAESMARILAPEFDRIVISTPGTFKKSDPEEVFRCFKKIQPDTVIEIEPGRALETALELSRAGEAILVAGSFYMIAEIRSRILKSRQAIQKGEKNGEVSE